MLGGQCTEGHSAGNLQGLGRNHGEFMYSIRLHMCAGLLTRDAGMLDLQQYL